MNSWSWPARPPAKLCLPIRFFGKPLAEHVARRRAILEDVRKRFKPSTTSWFSAAIQSISRGEIPEEDLGRDRQSLPGVRRLHLRLPGLHLLHGDRSPGGDRMEWNACASGIPAR